MPVNTGTVHGGDVVLFYNTGTLVTPIWTPIAHATSHSIKHSTSMREIASITTGKDTSVRPGKNSPSALSISGIRTYDGADYYTLKVIRDSFAKIQFKLAGHPTADTIYMEVKEASGDKYETGFGYISSLSADNPNDNSSTYSVEIMIDGGTSISTAT